MNERKQYPRFRQFNIDSALAPYKLTEEELAHIKEITRQALEMNRAAFEQARQKKENDAILEWLE